MMRLLLSGLLLGALLMPLDPLAAQDGLYAPRLDGDTALVRVVNLQNGPLERLDVGPRRFSNLDAGEVTPYRSVAPGVYLVGGRNGVMLSPAPASFITVVVQPDGRPAILEDVAHRDPARAQVVLYNFSSRPADLVAPELQAVIVEAVPPTDARARAVNALTVDLAIRLRDRSGASDSPGPGGSPGASGSPGPRSNRPVGTLELRRGESYGIFVTEDAVAVHAARVAPD